MCVCVACSLRWENATKESVYEYVALEHTQCYRSFFDSFAFLSLRFLLFLSLFFLLSIKRIQREELDTHEHITLYKSAIFSQCFLIIRKSMLVSFLFFFYVPLFVRFSLLWIHTFDGAFGASGLFSCSRLAFTAAHQSHFELRHIHLFFRIISALQREINKVVISFASFFFFSTILFKSVASKKVFDAR